MCEYEDAKDVAPSPPSYLPVINQPKPRGTKLQEQGAELKVSFL